MKYYVYGCLILLGLGLSVKAGIPTAESNYEYAGTVAVGSQRGSECTLSLSLAEEKKSQASTAGLYSERKIARFKQNGRLSSFWMEDYSGQFFGSKQYIDTKGIRKKTTIIMFRDESTQTFKTIIHDANLVSDGSVGNFIVCENMVIRAKANRGIRVHD